VGIGYSVGSVGVGGPAPGGRCCGRMLRRRGRVERIPAPDGRIADHEVHPDVMRLERQLGDDELLHADPDAERVGQLGQEPVVQPLAATEATPLRVERDAWDDDDVHVRRVDGWTGGLADPELPGHEGSPGGVADRHQLVTLDAGEQHRAARRWSIDQLGQVDLVGVGHVQQHAAGLLDLRQVAQVGDDPSRCRGDDVTVQLATLREESPATLTLRARLTRDIRS